MRADRRIQDLCQDIYQYVEDPFQVAVQRAEVNAREFVRGELKDRRGARQDSIGQSEARVVELVREILDQYDSARRKRQEQESEDITDRVEERLRQVVVVAKTAVETQAREMVAQQASATGPTCASTVTATASACTSATNTANKAAAPTKSRPRPQRRLEWKTRAQVDEVREEEAVRAQRRLERRARAKMDRIWQEAHEAVRTRAATQAAELLDSKPIGSNANTINIDELHVLGS
ncbi:hypothetical protein V7S43_013133 [Phytophthora oleae]|uniref:Uncharacterized protein n=1 Tax=Phytophthora oleae TaxID=2107226 RepID=A0ABD3F8L6_9STRA